MSYPETLEIVPLKRPSAATVRVPGSKSITNRALILAALSDPDQGAELHGALRSEDTEVMITALRDLGYRVDTDWSSQVVHVRRGHLTRLVPAPAADLYVANSGTSMRFLIALVSLGSGRYRLDGVMRMRERPVEDLLSALRDLGSGAYSEAGNGYPPVVVMAHGLTGGTAHIRGDVSSQFLSALLMVAPLAREPVSIRLDGPLVSRPYVAMTVALMRAFGCQVATDGMTRFDPSVVPWYPGRRLNVEPDASAASYFLAAAAVTGGEVTVPGLNSQSLQGDIQFANIMEEMGCQVYWHEHAIHLEGCRLRGVDVDMNAISDTVMTLAAVACFAEGPTTIRNVAHIRHKETDRITALATELRKVGAEVDEFPDGLRITPRPLHGAEIETYHDHRMAMSMALIGLRVPGIVIKNPGCVAKTYPRFWEDLERLRMTQWHPIFVHLLRPMVEAHFEVQTNVPVGDMPREADTVLLRRQSAGALPYQGIWRNLTTWNVLEYKGRTVSPRVRDLDAMVELGLGIDRRLNEERVRRSVRLLPPRDVSFWLLGNRLGRRFLREARLRLPGLEQIGDGIWRCALLQRMVFLVSSVHLALEEDSLPLQIVGEGSAEAAKALAHFLVEQPLLWKQYGSWLRVLHGDQWKEIQDMARATRKKLEIDMQPVRDAMMQDKTGELFGRLLERWSLIELIKAARKGQPNKPLTKAEKRELQLLLDQ